MKRWLGLAIGIALLPCPPLYAKTKTVCSRATEGLNDTTFVALAADASNPGQLAAASRQAVYLSTDGGKTWREHFRLPTHAQALSVTLTPTQPLTVLAATTRGLYGSFDGGKEFSLVWKNPEPEDENALRVFFHPAKPETLLLGTQEGLLKSADGGKTWSTVNAPSGARPVIDLAFDPHNPDGVYVLTPKEIFSANLEEGQWHLLNAAVAKTAEIPADQPADDADSVQESGSLFHAIAVDFKQPGSLYVATDRGIYASRDFGQTWAWMTTAGLPALVVTRILALHHSPLMLYAATEQGVARRGENTGQWQAITPGFLRAKIYDMAEAEGKLWLATEEGLFSLDLSAETINGPDIAGLLSNFVHEPTIGQVREAAIRYAEVHPDKIQTWRKQASLKALLPHVNLGIDHGRSNNIHVDEGTFPHFQVIETRDHDAGVDFSVTWELADLIWNNEQTSIDTRSKLMVELRDEIVDQVTRFYFERRRLQVGLMTQLPAENEVLLEKHLRIQELTALIDGLTGGYFSANSALPTHTPGGS